MRSVFIIADGKFTMVSAGKFDVNTNGLTASSEIHWFGESPLPVLISSFLAIEMKSCIKGAVAQNSQSEAVIKKIPVGVGVSVLSFLSRDHTK